MRTALVLIWITACSEAPQSHGGFHDLQTRGMLGVPSNAAVLGNIVAADAEVDMVGGAKLLVDTGAPVTLIAPNAFPAAGIAPSASTVHSLIVGGLEIVEAPVLLVSIQNGGAPFTLGGILGANVFCQFPTSFDYRDQKVTLGGGAVPADLGDDVVVPFSVMGGGRVSGSSLVLQATRIVLPVTIEGGAYTFMVDTGASATILSADLFAKITADGRGRLDDLSVGTVGGNFAASATRLHQMQVGELVVTDVAAMTVGAPQLTTISAEVGLPLDGLVGGTFLRELYLTVDYPARLLHLRRYPSRAHIVDEFVRVGVELKPSGTGFVVDVVHQKSDAAAQGIVSGDQVLAIGGTPLDGLDASSATRLLYGTAGESKVLQLGPASAPRTLTVLVEDLIRY